MSHTYCHALFHCVFSTSQRARTIPEELQSELWSYMGGIARQHGMKAVAIGGTRDHVHLLIALPPTIAVAEAMRVIKSVSSRWMHEQHGLRRFAWQEGYGAFSVGKSQIKTTIAYIQNQKEHHRKRDFKGEFVAFLVRHGIEYDPRYVLG